MAAVSKDDGAPGEVSYALRAKSGSWTHHPDAHDPGYQLREFLLTVRRGGVPLGGHNVQVVVGHPDSRLKYPSRRTDRWLDSGWWVSWRNEFAQAPDVASAIFDSVEAAVSELTRKLTTARGADTEELTKQLWATGFDATGPDHWPGWAGMQAKAAKPAPPRDAMTLGHRLDVACRKHDLEWLVLPCELGQTPGEDGAAWRWGPFWCALLRPGVRRARTNDRFFAFHNGRDEPVRDEPPPDVVYIHPGPLPGRKAAKRLLLAQLE